MLWSQLLLIICTAVGINSQDDGDLWPCNLYDESVQCDQTSLQHMYHGDPESCYHFYQCGSGGFTIHRFQCAGTTMWNRTGFYCTDNLPPAQCEPPCPDDVTVVPTKICSTAETPCTPGWRYPDEIWCEGYHRCNSDGTITIRACRTDGWRFNVFTQKCEKTVSDEICRDRCLNANPPKTTSVSSSQVRDGDLWPCNLVDGSVSCDTTSVENTYHGDPESCNHFYQCGSGGFTVHRQECPSNTMWNRTGYACVANLPPEQCEPRCAAGVTQVPIRICSTAETPCTPGWNYPDEVWCEGYHRCNSDGSLTVRACRTDGWKFNVFTQQCEQTVSDDVCQNRCANANPPKATGAP